MFENLNGWAAQMRDASPASADLLGELEGVIAPRREVRFADDDAVIGDFGPHNVLVDAGQVTGVVDAEASGRGTRVYDLWSLMSDDLPVGWRDRVLTKILEIVDVRAVAVLHAHDIIRPFDWTVATPDPAYVEASVAAGWSRLDSVRYLLS